MRDYAFLNIPQNCFHGKNIPKKGFYETKIFKPSDRRLFTSAIEKIRWVYVLSHGNINIKPYKDDVREYEEIHVIEVALKKDYKLERIAEIITYRIPYPLLLIYRHNDKMRFFVAHFRSSQRDYSKNTFEDMHSSDWQKNDGALLAKLDFMKMKMTNFFTLYTDLVDKICIHNLSTLKKVNDNITVDEARILLAKVKEIEKEIEKVKAMRKKEDQINKRVDLRYQIDDLEKKIKRVLRDEN